MGVKGIVLSSSSSSSFKKKKKNGKQYTFRLQIKKKNVKVYIILISFVMQFGTDFYYYFFITK